MCIGKKNHTDFIIYLFVTLAEILFIMTVTIIHFIQMLRNESYIETDLILKWVIGSIMFLIFIIGCYVI